MSPSFEGKNGRDRGPRSHDEGERRAARTGASDRRPSRCDERVRATCDRGGEEDAQGGARGAELFGGVGTAQRERHEQADRDCKREAEPAAAGERAGTLERLLDAVDGGEQDGAAEPES